MRRLLWSIWVATIAVLAASIYIGIVRDVFDIDRVFVVIGDGAFATVAVLILRKFPRHPIGWIFLVLGSLFALETLARNYVDTPVGADLPLGGLVLAFVISKAFVFYLVLLALAFLTFPTGRLLSQRWKPVVTVLVIAGIVATPAFYLLPGPLDDEAPLSRIRNPYSLGGSLKGALMVVVVVTMALLIASLVASVLCMFIRFSRARGEERLQIKWFAVGALGLVAGLLLALPAWTKVVEGTLGDLLQAQLSLGITFLPISAGVAILRYRLYEIDVIINRTLVYGVLTATLGLVYVGLVAGIGTFAGESNLVVAGSTLTVAALFQPARTRFQGFIDRRFNRQRYDAVKTVEAFSARLRDEIDLDALSREILAVVQGTMQPARVALWLRSPEGGEQTPSRPRMTSEASRLPPSRNDFRTVTG
jgi:hypothetical protein